MRRTLFNVADFVRRERRYWPTVALFAGFLWDFFTLGRPDQLFDNAVIIFYLLLSGGGILVMARRREKSETEVSLLLLTVIQFAFGNLASALLILYSTSGTLAGSGLFLFGLVALLIGNEFLKNKYGLLRFNITIYYTFLFAYSALAVPVLLRDIGTHIFLLSGIASLLVISFYFFIFRFVAPLTFVAFRDRFITTVIVVFTIFHLLFFFNLIPPVPLALKDIGIYHNVLRTNGSFIATFEKPAWYVFWRDSDKVFHAMPGDTASCFSAVFAPEELRTPIFHVWEQFDTSSDEWKERSKIPFPIQGGREDGFRGFTEKGSLTEGKWRCSVQTERGTLLGREEFSVVFTANPPELISKER